MACIHRFIGSNNDYRWEDVETVDYAGKGFEGVIKRVLIGPEEDAPYFILRYFRVEPGQHTNLERHAHDHGVVILHGKARVQLNAEFHEVGPMDVVYIAGDDLHQFTNLGEEAMGFLCVIQRK